MTPGSDLLSTNTGLFFQRTYQIATIHDGPWQSPDRHRRHGILEATTHLHRGDGKWIFAEERPAWVADCGRPVTTVEQRAWELKRQQLVPAEYVRTLGAFEQGDGGRRRTLNFLRAKVARRESVFSMENFQRGIKARV